jgi:hypothetical protein
VVVSKIKVQHAQLVGLHLANGTRLVAVTANTALNNSLDCQDESPRGSNSWQENVGVTSDPPGLWAHSSGRHNCLGESARIR